MANHPLAVAAREVNDYAEKNGLGATCEKFGIKLEDLKYMAEQRALRTLYVARGARDVNFKQPFKIQLSPADLPLYLALVAAYMDGIIIGWRGKECEQSK